MVSTVLPKAAPTLAVDLSAAPAARGAATRAAQRSRTDLIMAG